jgi:hypothetical protein
MGRKPMIPLESDCNKMDRVFILGFGIYFGCDF